MAKLKSLLSKAKNVAGTPARKYNESKTRVADRNKKQYEMYKQAIADMEASGVEAGSPSDPNSLAHARIQVQNFEANQNKPRKRLFGRNKN